MWLFSLYCNVGTTTVPGNNVTNKRDIFDGKPLRNLGDPSNPTFAAPQPRYTHASASLGA